MRATLPKYAAHVETFRCIGPDCEDTCCQGWNIPIDRAAYDKYADLPASPLSQLISISVSQNPVSAAQTPVPAEVTPNRNASSFAQIRIDGFNRCPLLNSERLCVIQAELGEDMLPHACSSYPRISHRKGSVQETALALSCPEAARLILLDRDLLAPNLTPANPQNLSPDDAAIKPFPLDFIAIRESVLSLLRLRTYPLWQRIFLLGLMCRRLDSIARGEMKRSVPLFLGDFKKAVVSGSLRPAMETLPIDRPAQLDIVLRLAGLMLHRSSVSPRFSASVQAFTAGIGNGPGATLESLTEHYARAHDLYFEPFFRRHPHILENYLVNAILRCEFPYGSEGMKSGLVAHGAEEFAKLTAQFALMRGLLIGVAGHHGTAFSTAHVVATVQSAAKHFEHHPEFLKLSYELLLESQMDGARGMAILLRNAGQAITATVVPGAHAPGPQLPVPLVSLPAVQPVVQNPA